MNKTHYTAQELMRQGGLTDKAHGGGRVKKMMGGGHAKQGPVQKKFIGGLVSAALPILGSVAGHYINKAFSGSKKSGGKVKGSSCKKRR